MKKLKPLCTVGGNIKWYSCCGKQYHRCTEKLKIELTYDPAIPQLGIYPKDLEVLSQGDTCIFMFISSIIHKSQKVKATQVSINGWICKIWYSSPPLSVFSLSMVSITHGKPWQTMAQNIKWKIPEINNSKVLILSLSE